MVEAILPTLAHLWVLVLVPMVLLAFVRRSGRIAFFLLGLGFYFSVPYLQAPQGPDSIGLGIPLYGLPLSAGAVLAEIPALFIRRLRTRREAVRAGALPDD